MADAVATTALSHSQQELWNTKDGKQIDTDGLEDPALKWIELIEACKTQDPAKVRAVINMARTSKWTRQLWIEETGGGYDSWESGKEDEDSDVDVDWVED